MRTLRQALSDAVKRLVQAGVVDAKIDAGWILQAVAQCPRLMLPFEERALTQEEETRLEDLLSRRAQGEPLQYILGNEGFYGLDFAVDPRVLIPRPDTELLCELALAAIGTTPCTALDLCTGSGILAIILALRCPQAQIFAGDISQEALAVARANAITHKAPVSFLQGDLFTPFQGRIFDCILSNPPYIPQKDLPTLARELSYEPILALDGGADGLDFYRRIAQEAPHHLALGGHLLLEIGADQGAAVAALLHPSFESIQVHQDLNGRDRVVSAVFTKNSPVQPPVK